MNFTPFSTTYSGSIPTGGTVTQFTSAAKFGSNIAAGGGQVVGLLASDEAGVTYLRPVDANGFTLNLAQGSSSADGSQLITLPITVPGAKPGDMPQQQTLQIQVVNPGGAGGTEKFLPISLQPFQQGNTTVLTVAYANPDQDSPDQPIQLQLQTTDQASQAQQQQNNNNNSSSSGTTTTTTISQTQSGLHSNEIVLPDVKGMSDEAGEEATQQAYPVAVVTHIPSDLILRTEDQDKDGQQGSSSKDKQQDKDKDNQGRSILEVCLTGEGYTTSGATTASVATSTSATQVAWAQTQASVGTTVVDYLSRLSGQNLPLSLHHYLKFSPETIKREAQIESSPLQDQDGNPQDEMDPQHAAMQEDPNKAPKKKKKYKKKAPKPRKPRPGQVHIAFALDGTTLFCCPECNMAYPEKELLEQHLGAHKIERRFICDICGAGLKRKEHLERHKLGHNPERPYICSVCCKGFKRKEHLNLHFVIHSGEKSEVCPECGKGFHRKDHLRKHARSHLAKRVKEETIIVETETQLAQAQAQAQVQNAVAQQASVVLAQQQAAAVAAAAQLAAVQTQHAEAAVQQVAAHQQPIILTTQHHHQH